VAAHAAASAQRNPRTAHRAGAGADEDEDEGDDEDRNNEADTAIRAGGDGEGEDADNRDDLGRNCDEGAGLLGDDDAVLAPTDRVCETRGGFSREGSDTVETNMGLGPDSDDADDDGADEPSADADDDGDNSEWSNGVAESPPALPSTWRSVPSLSSSLTYCLYAASDSQTWSSAGAHSGGMQNATSPKLALVRRSVGAAAWTAAAANPKPGPDVKADAGRAGGDGSADATAALESTPRADGDEVVCSGRCECNCGSKA
jgi:hypothetical protein